jgi:hypothetical protein
MALSFSSKARTLESLQDNLKSARIAPLVIFTVQEWKVRQEYCLNEVLTVLGTGPWIVRSSSINEDQTEASNAGKFLSVSDVEQDYLVCAVDQVIASYISAQPTDEVLIQPMLNNVIRSGVAFSHDPNTCAPYRIVNWHEGSDTSVVTGGMGGRSWQLAGQSPAPKNSIFVPIVKLVDELLEIFGDCPLDCEFAVTRDSQRYSVWLLQARPLIMLSEPETSERQMIRLEQIRQKIDRGMQSHPFLLGERTVYGVMPDWNPAEIIGVRPKPLALSLYRELFTDSIWAYQRHNYGYRNLRSFILMPNFFGLPYIDVRVSFNSFIPADLDEETGSRLVDYYIDKLVAQPKHHDKVEFEIVWSCYTLDLPKNLERLNEFGFSRNEQKSIADSLRKITNRILSPKEGLWREDAKKLSILKKRRLALSESGVGTVEKIYWLLEDAKRYGTLPFAGLARVGFIAVQILKSLVNLGVFSEADYECFMGSISTVSGQMKLDRLNMEKSEFIKNYGHLRPGTYNILSPRYDEAPELYFDWSYQPTAPSIQKPFEPSSKQNIEIEKLLQSNSLESDPLNLLKFIKSAIELRELAKFGFTHNLSDALLLITRFGCQNGIATEDMAYCDIRVFQELQGSAIHSGDLIKQSIEKGKNQYLETARISLPPLITNLEDVLFFEWPETAPNFITQKKVVAPVVSSNIREQLNSAIVCIPNADPGFDWLFSYPISGLVTAWGGANSHMAIRAGEQNLPAVIGAGELLYSRWSKAKRLQIDCAARKVEVLG